MARRVDEKTFHTFPGRINHGFFVPLDVSLCGWSPGATPVKHPVDVHAGLRYVPDPWSVPDGCEQCRIALAYLGELFGRRSPAWKANRHLLRLSQHDLPLSIPIAWTPVESEPFQRWRRRPSEKVYHFFPAVRVTEKTSRYHSQSLCGTPWHAHFEQGVGPQYLSDKERSKGRSHCPDCVEAVAWLEDEDRDTKLMEPSELPVVVPAEWSAARRAALEARKARTEAPREVRMADVDWSFAKGEDLVYGSTHAGDGYIVLPRIDLESLASLRAVMDRAKTWGALRRELGRDEVEDIAEVSRVLEEGRYAGKALSDVPDRARLRVSAYEEGDWPRSPGQVMGSWMPHAVLEEFCAYETAMLGDGWWVVADLEGLLSWLERAGATCERDDDLVSQA